MFSSILLAGLVLARASNALVPPYHLSRAADDLQTSLVLDPSQIQPGLANDGQDVPEAGQVPSLTSVNNFINFCATQTGVPLTNGQQIKTGSCNPTPMGRVIQTDKLPSSKFVFPLNGGTVQANTTFTIKMAISNLVTGNFVNAAANYYSAPCTVDNTGTVVGHSHVVVEPISAIDSTEVTAPLQFSFFKGLNAAAVGGVLTADVTGGLAPGAYRLASLNSCSNHQPVLASVAQHGAMDDQVYFTVTEGAAGTSGSGALAGGAGTGSSTSVASGTVASSTSIASVSSVASAISTSVDVSTTAVAASTSIASTSTSVAASTSTTAASTVGNLQTFTGAAGGLTAPAVTGPGADGRFSVTGVSGTFATSQAAVQRSCDVQHNACADKANQTGDLASLDQNTCTAQATQCTAAVTGAGAAPAGSSPSSTVPTASTASPAVAVAASATPTTLANGNLQLFTGVAGGTEAPAVTGPGADGRFTCQGNTFSSKADALQRSCSIQHNACANQANATGNLGTLNQTTCQNQEDACNASASQ